MIGLGFIMRILWFLFWAALAIVAILGLSSAIAWVIRITWDVFERNFELQAAWMIDKIKPKHFHKSLLVPFVFVAILLCIAVTFLLILISSRGAAGETIGMARMVIWIR